MARWRIILVVGLLLACLGLSATLYRAGGGDCRNPAFLTRTSAGLDYPIPAFDQIIAVTGGLPRSNAEWDGFAYEFPHYLHLHPVTTWRIVSVQAWTNEPIQQRLVDDDPTYSLTLDIEVEYADGSLGLLRWSRWQYGLLLCPFVVPAGDGPPWTVQKVE
jgi:hypothetical protein